MARPKKHPNHKYESVTIYLPPSVKAWFQQEANRHGRPLSGEIAFILSQYQQGLHPAPKKDDLDLFQALNQFIKGVQRVFHL